MEITAIRPFSTIRKQGQVTSVTSADAVTAGEGEDASQLSDSEFSLSSSHQVS